MIRADIALFFITFILYTLSTTLYFSNIFLKNKQLSKYATLSLVSGFIFHTLALFIRAILSLHIPMVTLFESMLFFLWTVVLTYIYIEKRYGFKVLGVFVTPLVFIGFAYAAILPKEITPLIPALQSNWLEIHATVSFLSYGFFVIATVASFVYLVQESILKSKKQIKISNLLPSLQALDNLCYALVIFGFPLLTLGIITGALWAEKAWGSYWSWDPKETWSLITWLIYAAYLHSRFTARWKGRKSAYLLIIGFIAILITYLGVNLLSSGLHRYT